MLSEAILSIRAAQDAAAVERERRLAAREAQRRAEEYGCILEEFLLRGDTELPVALVIEIRRFVAEHERGLSRRIGDPVSTLDAIFDLQERLQTRRSDGLGEVIGRRVA